MERQPKEDVTVAHGGDVTEARGKRKPEGDDEENMSRCDKESLQKKKKGSWRFTSRGRITRRTSEI